MADTRDLIAAEINNGIFEFQNNPARDGEIGFIVDGVLGAIGLVYSDTKPAQPGYYWWDGDDWADPQVVFVEHCFGDLFVKGRTSDQERTRKGSWTWFYRPLKGLGGRFADCPKPPESEERS